MRNRGRGVARFGISGVLAACAALSVHGTAVARGLDAALTRALTKAAE
jgi:hypothetical protein